MKIGRNDPCPCGSGKKFKHCCIDKPEYKWEPPQAMPFQRQKEQMTSGLNRLGSEPSIEDLGSWMENGYQQVDDTEACDVWWRTWVVVRQFAEENAIHSLADLDERLQSEQMKFTVSGWLDDLSEVLHNAGLEQPEYLHRRLELSRAVLSQFAESDAESLVFWSCVEAECILRLENPLTADASYSLIIDRFPDDASAYMAWADEYHPRLTSNPQYANADKARQIYQMGLEHGTNSDDELRDRIELLGRR